MRSWGAIQCVLVVAFLSCMAAAALHRGFDAYHMTRVDVSGTSIGSQQALMNLMAVPIAPGDELSAGYRSGAILGLTDVIRRHEQYLEEAEGVEQAEKEKLFQKHMLGSMGGAVVVVPSAADLTAEELEAWKEVEESFAANTLTSPYYFLQDSEEFQEVYRLVKENAASGGLSTLLQLIEGHSYQLVSSASQPSRIKGAEGALIQGWLAGTGREEGATPTVLIMAHYDHFSLVPGLSQGANDNASGTVALLELARLYHLLYRQASAPSPFNLLFLLTSGAPLNYQGAQEWLLSVDTRLAKSVELVLSLEELASGSLDDPLFLHASRPIKDPVARRLYESFEKTAEQASVNFEVKHYKVDLSDDELPWEHEHFSRARYLAATFTAKEYPAVAHETSVLDSMESVDLDVFNRNVKFVAEALAAFMYDIDSDEVKIFDALQVEDERYARYWMESFTNAQRATGHVSDVVVTELERALSPFAADVSITKFTLNPEYTFFTFSPATLAAHPVKPFLFDVLLTLVIAAVLSAMYFGVKSVDFL